MSRWKNALKAVFAKSTPEIKAEPALATLPTPQKAYEVGYQGTVEDIQKTLENLKTAPDRHGRGRDYYGPNEVYKALQRMHDGVIDAALENRTDAVKFYQENRAKYVAGDCNIEGYLYQPNRASQYDVVHHLFSRNAKRRERIDIEALVAIAEQFMTQASPEKKEDIYSRLLYKTLAYRELLTEYTPQEQEKLLKALFKGGAKTNFHSSTGMPGEMLANAVHNKYSLQVVKLLLDNGASFNETMFMMNMGNYAKAAFDNLHRYREMLTDKVSPDNKARIDELQQQVKELTQRVNKLTTPKEPANASAEPMPFYDCFG